MLKADPRNFCHFSSVLCINRNSGFTNYHYNEFKKEIVYSFVLVKKEIVMKKKVFLCANVMFYSK